MEEHVHEEEDVIREEVPIMYRDGEVDKPGFLIKFGSTYFFETDDRKHISVHLFRLR